MLGDAGRGEIRRAQQRKQGPCKACRGNTAAQTVEELDEEASGSRLESVLGEMEARDEEGSMTSEEVRPRHDWGQDGEKGSKVTCT